MPETMWAVAGGIIIGGFVLWLLRTGLEFLFQGSNISSLGGVMLIVGLILAWYVIGGQVFGIYFEGNTMMHRQR